MSELSQQNEKDCQIRQYIRRPDKLFWLDLLNPPPLPTQADHTRRTRVTRYAIGAAFALTTFYFLISFFMGGAFKLANKLKSVWAKNLLPLNVV